MPDVWPDKKMKRAAKHIAAARRLTMSMEVGQMTKIPSPPQPERQQMSQHAWIKSTLGHGDSMCSKCKITNREAAVLGELNHCPIPDPQPEERNDDVPERSRPVLTPAPDAQAGEARTTVELPLVNCPRCGIMSEPHKCPPLQADAPACGHCNDTRKLPSGARCDECADAPVEAGPALVRGLLSPEYGIADMPLIREACAHIERIERDLTEERAMGNGWHKRWKRAQERIARLEKELQHKEQGNVVDMARSGRGHVLNCELSDADRQGSKPPSTPASESGELLRTAKMLGHDSAKDVAPIARKCINDLAAHIERIEKENDRARGIVTDLVNALERAKAANAAAQERIARLEKEKAAGREQRKFMLKNWKADRVARYAAQAQVARLREALEYYASHDNWMPKHHGILSAKAPVQADRGQRARAALSEGTDAA